VANGSVVARGALSVLRFEFLLVFVQQEGHVGRGSGGRFSVKWNVKGRDLKDNNRTRRQTETAQNITLGAVCIGG
jgi:hypothetical protein